MNLPSNRFARFARLPESVLRLSFFLLRNRRFLNRLMHHHLVLAGRSNVRPVLDAGALQRMQEYALLGSAMGAMFAMLRGQALDPGERMSFALLSLFAAAYDDAFDDGTTKGERLRAMVADSGSFQPSGYWETFLLDCLRRTEDHVPDRNVFRSRFADVFRAQSASGRQAENGVAWEELQRITYDKGGYSALLYRSLLKHPERKGESEAFYDLGALIQLMDDLFDAYGDSRDRLHTLVTDSRDLSRFEKLYRSLIAQVHLRFRVLGYSTHRTESFLASITLIAARGGVCLGQLQSLAVTTRGQFLPEFYHESQLLCDMETIPNFLRSLQYFFEIGN